MNDIRRINDIRATDAPAAPPVFIVGVPRSGTTLLAAMLAAHSRMSCGPETHFFRQLTKSETSFGVDPDSLVDPQTWPSPALDFICSITHSSFSSAERLRLTDKYQLQKDQIESFLAAREPSVANMLASVAQPFMERMGKFRWVEKTPDHIQSVRLIRKYFADSPILRIVRDPRDVALSLRRVPWGAMSFMEAFSYWRAMDESSDDFFKTDQLSYSLRYEDLIASPKEELIRVCEFLGEDFEESMLDTSSTGKMLNSRNVPWKDKASQPVDATRISLWKKEFSPEQNQLAEAMLGDRLEVYGYPREAQLNELGEFYPNHELALKYADGLLPIPAKGVRFWKVDPNEKPTALVYLGDPAMDHWFGEQKLASLSAVWDIFTTTLSKKHIYWIAGQEINSWTGLSSFIVRRLLRPHKVETDWAPLNHA